MTGAVLNGRVGLVTGASSGLGRATSVALARAGADVVLLGRSQAQLATAAAEVEKTGRRAFTASADLNDAEATAAAFERAVAAAGRLDILVNAAATDAPGPATEVDVRQWDHVLAVNLRAPYQLAGLAFPYLQRAGGGTIVNVSSVAGKRGWANAGAYCASKFGLTGLTQSLAAEGRPHDIRVCALYPGGMDTRWGTFDAEREQDQAGSTAPRPATESLPPEHVADLIVWIAGAPPELVLNEAVVAPLHEAGWP